METDIDEQIFNKHYTDGENAEALALLYGDKLRYVHGIGWHIWTGSHWQPDAESKARQFVKQLALKREKLVYDFEADPDKKKKLFNQAVQLENAAKVDSCLTMAESTSPFSCLPNALDRDPMLLASHGNTINLRTGAVYKPKQSDLITKCTNTIYNPNAKAPRWKKYLGEVFVLPHGAPDVRLILWLKKALGLTLTGYVNERLLFVCYGGGFNGKTTLFNILHHILGDYAQTASFSSFIAKQNEGGPDNDLAGLRGSRFVSAVEAKQLGYLDEVRVKRITGTDPVKCRFLYHEPFQYYPTYKIWLATNYKPKIRGTDEAIWGRLKLIPFTVNFKANGREDQNLGDKLKAEEEGILAWMVEGCLDWQKQKLGVCQAVDVSTKQYREEEDVFAQFLSEKITKKSGTFLTTQSIWKAYNDWARNNGERQIANTTQMGKEMSSRGYIGSKNNKGERGFDGIDFK